MKSAADGLQHRCSMGMYTGIKGGKGSLHQINIHSHDSLIICSYSGQITIDEIEHATEEMVNRPEFSKAHDGVSDFRQAKVLFTRNELERFNAKAIENSFSTGSWCILADSPMETAMALIYAHEMKEVHPVEVFSTVQGASDFLKKDLSRYLSENYRRRRTFHAPTYLFETI